VVPLGIETKRFQPPGHPAGQLSREPLGGVPRTLRILFFLPVVHSASGVSNPHTRSPAQLFSVFQETSERPSRMQSNQGACPARPSRRQRGACSSSRIQDTVLGACSFIQVGPPPNQRLKLTCHRSPLPTCVTFWRQNQAVPAAQSAGDTQLSREPLDGTSSISVAVLG
jgi:hypothetical protein